MESITVGILFIVSIVAMSIIVRHDIKEIELKIARTRLCGELKVEKDGLYIGDVKLKGVTKYTIEPSDGLSYKVNFEVEVLDKDWYK